MSFQASASDVIATMIRLRDQLGSLPENPDELARQVALELGLDVAHPVAATGSDEDATDREIIADSQVRLDGGEETVPLDIIMRISSGENPVRVWRDHRGMTQMNLADVAGLKQAQVSKLETGTLKGNIGMWGDIADALNVSLDDLRSPKAEVR